MRSLYSAIYINADEDQGPGDRWTMFDQCCGQPMPGQRGPVIMNSVHTNIPRSGYAGLPRDWAMRVDSWRAQTSLRFLVDPVLEWASETVAELHYRARSIERISLVDLLLAAQPCSDSTDWEGNFGGTPVAQPLVFRECVNYEVTVTSTTNAMKNFRRWIVANVESARMTLWIHLQGPINHGAM